MSAQTVANALISASQIDTLNGHLESIASKVGVRSVTKVNNVTPDATGNISINTGVLTVNSNPPDANGNININADTGVHPTQLVMSQNGVHGFRYDGNFLYIKDSSDVEHRVQTSGQSVIGTVEITVDSGTDVSGKIVSLIKDTEISSSVFDNNNEATVYTLASGNYTLHIDGYDYTTTVNVANTGTTTASVTIPKSTITVLTQDSTLLGKPVILSDGQTGTFPNAFPSGSDTASVLFDVYTGGTYNAICKKTENSYFSSSDQLVTIGTNYQLSIASEATITLTLNGAAGDIISIKNADNETVGSCSFTGSNTSGETTITVPYSDLGNNNRPYTFISGVAKALDESGNDYSKNYTLTNSLSQSVNVYPDVTKYWIGNYTDTWSLLAASNQAGDYTKIAPRLIDNINSFEIYNANNTSGGGSGCTGVYQVPVDVTDLSQIVIKVTKDWSSTVNKWSGLKIYLSSNSTGTLNAISGTGHNVYVISEQGSTPIGSDGIVSIDTSNLTGTVYLNIHYYLGDAFNSQSASKLIGMIVDYVYGE